MLGKLNLSKDKLLLILLGGILLIVISWPVKDGKDDGERNNSQSDVVIAKDEDYATMLENKICSVLEAAYGKDNVKVVVTLENDGRKILKSDIKQSEKGGPDETAERTVEETVVYLKGSDGSLVPYILEQVSPTVKGVLIVAKNGDNPQVQSDIVRAVKALLGIGANKIMVMKMEV